MKKPSNFPHEAIAVIDVVLQLGRQERKYPDAFWRTLPMEEHINSAKMHLTDFIYNTSPGEDHLAHALTRLAMAISLRESEDSLIPYTPPDEETHEYGCECVNCRPDLWRPRVNKGR